MSSDPLGGSDGSELDMNSCLIQPLSLQMGKLRPRYRVAGRSLDHKPRSLGLVVTFGPGWGLRLVQPFPASGCFLQGCEGGSLAPMWTPNQHLLRAAGVMCRGRGAFSSLLWRKQGQRPVSDNDHAREGGEK